MRARKTRKLYVIGNIPDTSVDFGGLAIVHTTPFEPAQLEECLACVCFEDGEIPPDVEAVTLQLLKMNGVWVYSVGHAEGFSCLCKKVGVTPIRSTWEDFVTKYLSLIKKAAQFSGCPI